MVLKDILDPRCVKLNAAAANKWLLLDQLLGLIASTGSIKDYSRAYADLYKREEQQSTGLDGGIAMPHVRTDAVTKTVMAAAVLPKGIDFNSGDGKPVHIVFLTLSPQGSPGEHIQILSELACLCSDADTVRSIMRAGTGKEVWQLIAC